MLTTKQFKKLALGTRVRWREGAKSPRAGELTDSGVVVMAYSVKSIKWDDGQITDGSDDWALQNIEVETLRMPNA